MKAAAIQMSSQLDVHENLAQARRLMTKAADAGAELLVLPENFAFLGARDSDRVRVAEIMGDGPAQEFLRTSAIELGVWLVGGTIPIRTAGQRTRSRSLLIGPDGETLACYDKLHLFDVDIPDREDESYRESETTEPGDWPVVATTPLGRIGMTVCYDLRFPALFHRMGVLGMDILVVPAAFTVPTGRVHWQPLLQARAFESLVYVVACGQWGEHHGGRLTYGHSCIVSPWGEILTQRESGIGVVIADLDMNRLRELRATFPVLKHRREF